MSNRTRFNTMIDLSYHNWYKAVSYDKHAAFHVNLYELNMFGEIFVISLFSAGYFSEITKGVV